VTERRLEKAKLLREQAKLARQSARIPTAGGHGESQLLLKLAERLEREADALAQSNTSVQADN